MNADTAKSSDKSRFKLQWFIAFATLAWLGNYLSLTLGFNVDFIFGSIFGLMAVVILGPATGALVSMIGASYTFLLWNHPYAIIIFTCEALWLGAMKKKHPNRSIVTIDLHYWLVLGTPLVLLFYFGVMKIGIQGTAIIALKQSVNGLSNAILASVLLSSPLLWKWLGRGAPPTRPMAHIIFESMAFLLLIPCIGGLIYMNQRDLQRTQEDLANRISKSGYEAAWLINDWLELHLHATQQLAERAATLGFAPSVALQHEVETVHNLFPHFHNMFVGDENATTLAFDPQINERGESTIGINFRDRQWFKRLKITKKPVISDVFIGRGGIFEPIVSISSPYPKNGKLEGFALGAVNLSHLQSFIHNLAERTGLSFTLIDQNQKVVIATVEGRNPLDNFTTALSQLDREIIKGVYLHLPMAQKNITVMQQWKKAVLISNTLVALPRWTVVTEGSLAPLQQETYADSIKNLGVISLLLLLTSAVSILMSRRMSDPLRELSRVSADIPAKIESGATMAWPAAESLELSTLIANFHVVADDLRDKFQRVQRHSQNLENIVAERTAELEKSMQEEERAKALLQTFFDQAPIAIAWTDQNMIFQYQNPRFINLTGYDMREDPSLFAWAKIAYPDEDYRNEVEQWRKQVLATESGGHLFDLWISHKNGSKRCCHAHVNRMPDGQYLVMLTDITDRMRYQEKLNAYAKSQNVLLQEVNHRVKNNLALLIGMLRLESRRIDTECHAEFMADIICRIQALSTVHSLLSSSEWKPIKLSELFGQIISNGLSNRKSYRLAISPTAVTIEASQAHNLALVINELATNSAKHAPDEEELEITIETSSHADEIEIVYRDNGPGYTEAQIRGEQEETGIGVQMIKGIVEMSLNGTILFSNQGGAQTTIRFKKES